MLKFLIGWWGVGGWGVVPCIRTNKYPLYVVERTNQAETRPEEQSEKVESCREN